MVHLLRARRQPTGRRSGRPGAPAERVRRVGSGPDRPPADGGHPARSVEVEAGRL